MAIKYNLTATKMRLTPSIRAHVEKKLAQIERLINKKDTSVHADVEVGKTTRGQHTGDVLRAEITMHVAGGSVRAEAVGNDLLLALDEVRQEVARQLRKHKTKRTDKVRRGAAKAKDQVKKLYRR